MTKVLQHIVTLFFLVGMFALQGCVDDDLDFPESESIVVTESTALVTFLNSINTATFNPDSPSITITYPVNLAFNTGIVIEVTSNQGLLEAVESQSSSLYIIGVEFPIEFIQNGEPVLVENENDFLAINEELELGTFGTDFDKFFLQCFDFIYPVTMINSSEQEVVVSTAGELTNFIDSEGVEYQPLFVFPIQLIAADNPVTVNSHFDFYSVFNSCDDCPELFFDVQEGENGQYTFSANFPGINTLPSYDWFINEQFIESDGVINEGDNQLIQILTPGTYTVCITAKTDDCPEGTDFCRNIVVEEDCPELFFSVANETPTMFIFRADFPSINTLPSYDWFINDQFIESDGVINEGDNTLLRTLEPGTYDVCIRAESVSCTTSSEFCRNIIVEDPCPDLFFNVTQGQFPRSFIFQADFPGSSDIIYEWQVIIDQTVIASEVDGPGGDDLFEYDFSPGTYDVCMVSEPVGCSPEARYCQQLVVE